MNLKCPHCNARFTTANVTPQKSAQCTSCKQRFPVAEQHTAPESDTDDAFPPVLIAFCVIAVLVVLSLILALATTPAISAGIVVSLGLAIVAYWKREAIQRYLAQRKQRAAERRKAKAQAAAEAKSLAASEGADSAGSSISSGDSTTADATVEPAAGTSDTNQPPVVAPWNVPPTTPDFFAEPAGEATQPSSAEQPAELPPPVTETTMPATVVSEPVESQTATQPPVIPVAPVPQVETSESEPLTAGLPEKYQRFLNAAMTQSKWPLRDLEAMARMHHLQWDDVVKAINEWSQERFNDPMLVQDGEEVWVQLPLI